MIVGFTALGPQKDPPQGDILSPLILIINPDHMNSLSEERVKLNNVSTGITLWEMDEDGLDELSLA